MSAVRRTAVLTGLTSLTALALLAALAGCGVTEPVGTAASPAAVLTTPTDDAAASQGLLDHPFAATSPWNSRTDTAGVDPSSATMLVDASERQGVVETGSQLKTDLRHVDNRIWINTSAWTVPVVSTGVPTKVVCRQADCGDGTPALTLDIPTDVDPDPRYDGWYSVLDSADNIAYDLWRARRQPDGSITAQYVKKWSLTGSGHGAPGQTSVRGSGLPLFAGLITADSLASGLIDHALAISVPGAASNTYVSPASATDGVGAAGSLPEGARIRLKASAVLPVPRDQTTGKPVALTAEQKRTEDAIAVALRTYGAIVVDRAAVPTLYAQAGIGSAILDPRELQGLTLNDFEVVKLGHRYTYPSDTSDTATTPSPAATPSTGETP